MQPSARFRSTPSIVAVTLATGLLLALAFPNFNQSWLAWVALTPLLALLRDGALSARHAFRWSWLAGFVFFLVSMWWLSHVTVFGCLVLAAYLALYVGLFGLFARWAFARRPPLAVLVLLPSAWVALEYARSHVMTGMGWNLLAYSQTGWTAVIQIADLAGAWGVSWLIVLVNAALVIATDRAAKGRIKRLACAGLAGACVAGALAYGAQRLTQVIKKSASVRVAVVQGNIPQDEKWDAEHQPRIQGTYDALTRTAAEGGPDLIVWPETSVPGYFGADEALTQRVLRLAADTRRTLLVGAPTLQVTPGGVRLRNTAATVGADGAIGTRHDKLHLVPYGEFIPFEQLVPWLRKVLPPIGDFTPGDAHTVFRVAGVAPFSVLICFEDVFPELARRFVRDGAELLFVITNDAWFGPTAAAYQHAQASAFRAVELRVPVARAANTGWSGCIDPTGRWNERVQDEAGQELFVAGTVTCTLPLGPAQSLYLRWGDWLPMLCLLGVFVSLVAAWSSVRFR